VKKCFAKLIISEDLLQICPQGSTLALQQTCLVVMMGDRFRLNCIMSQISVAGAPGIGDLVLFMKPIMD